jgi:Ca2+-binding RTX toxin-like protein
MTDIIGTAGSEVLNGGGGDDKISGLAGNDTLNGGGGVDELDGGTGADKMAGGASDDIYIVDSTKDLVIEAANQGFDVVLSEVNHTLAGNVEELVFLGVADLDGTGNALNNDLTGNAGKNRLDGGGGNDELFGADGDDLLIGGAGSDHHDGGSGDNTMQGGLGNDSYIVRSAGDKIDEAVGHGTDHVFSFIDIELSKFANVENVTLSTGAIAATGNLLDNQMVGNGAANVIDGGAGDDTLLGEIGGDTLTGGLGNDLLDGGTGIDQMSGGAGNDFYVVNNAGDIVIENAGEGIDTVRSSADFTLGANVENLILDGNAQVGKGNDLDNAITAGKTASQLSGFEGNDTLNGGAGRDRLDGGDGDDRMAAGGDNDTYVVDSGKDIVIEAANQGIDSVESTIDYTLGANVEDLLLLGDADLKGVGNTLNNVMAGNNGGNRLDGGVGNDTLSGAAGDDLLIGGPGNDELNGEAGNDTMRGGLGNDTYTVDSAGDKIDEAAGQGIDTIFGLTDVDLSQFANVENVTLLVNAQVAIGNALNNRITGNDLANTLSGGAGNDTYIVTNEAATVIENDKEGIDLVRSSVDFTLGANIENLTLIAAGNGVQTGRGNELGNVIIGSNDPSDLFGEGGNDALTGGTGEDILDGGAGNDRMTGGGGDDVYFVDNAKDLVIEAAKQGSDIVKSSVDFTLGANVEKLELLGAGNLKGVGNTLANDLSGNAGNNRLDGGAGNDTIGGADGEDTLQGGAGNDRLVGANDAAKDVLNGGAGNDVYVISDTLDVVIEGAGQGTDTILGLININLSKHANVENVTLDVFAVALAATGNALNNRITGNIRDNTLLGLDGNDTLDGGLGVDTLRGGIGNDTYFVTDDVDVIIENDKEGIDLVLSSVDYTLGANVENLTLTGDDALNGIGNEHANLIAGNDNNNVLLGNAGNDTLQGGGGDDILSGDLGVDKMSGGTGDDEYQVDNIGDIVTEAASQGIDTVQSSVSFTLAANIEHLFLTGNADINATGNTLNNDILGNVGNNRLNGGAGNDFLDGDFGNDTIDGGAGNDRIEGGRGADVMTGGAGADAFVYELDALAELGLIAGDTINGFQHGVDKVDLSDILSDFGIGANDAFTGGFLKIDIVGNDTRILFDSNGGGNDFLTLATLTNVKNVTVDDLAIQAI